VEEKVKGIGWRTWQDVVRTFLEENIEIPIYDIPVQRR